MTLESLINRDWDALHSNSTEAINSEECLKNVLAVMEQLDQGSLRIAEKVSNQWIVHQWIKKAILLWFRFNPSEMFEGSPSGFGHHFDKVKLKFQHWSGAQFQKHNIRAVPGAIVRYSAHIDSNVILMPSFINVGAWVGEGTMIDTWSTVGACAQIGARCHLSGGVGIGGVLEPLQGNPVIIEDHCFIGARSEIVEGVTVQQGTVIGMGVFIGASTPIVNRDTGKILYGTVPPYSVVIAGSMPSKTYSDKLPGLHLNCAVIVKTVDQKTRDKTSINDLLRININS